MIEGIKIALAVIALGLVLSVGIWVEVKRIQVCEQATGYGPFACILVMGK